MMAKDWNMTATCFDPRPSNCVSYNNGNYTVTLSLADGTMIRYSKDDKLVPSFPDSMDIKITNCCSLNCRYCFVGGTKILMGDLTYKNIEDVKIGDVVMGFEEIPLKRGAKRKMFKTKVLNTFVHVESELLTVTTDTGNTVTSTPNHPFLSEGTGKNHARVFNKIGNLSVGHNIFECGFPIDYIDYNSEQYKLGYTIGAWAGDGCFQHYVDKNGYDAYNCRFVTKDEEINDMVYECSKYFIPDLYRLDFKMKGNNGTKSSVRSNKRDVYNTIVKLESDNIGANTSKEYYCGFLAGFFDSEGHIDNQRSIVRLSNSEMKYINEITRCLNGLGIDNVIELSHKKDASNNKDVFNVRIKGQYAISQFLWYTRPVCNRKSLDNFLSYKFQYYKHKIANIEQVNKKQYVYNFETESHTYIANNFLVHNCHEKSTKDGLHGDILSDSFIDKLHPYTQLALGGGNILEHPDLVPFLKKCKELKLVPSVTVNQIHFMQQHKFLKQLTDEKLIYGLGISFHHPDKNFLPMLRSFPNAVIHTIAGITKERNYEFLADNGLKILILGYKKFGRGIQAYQESHQHIDYSIMNLKHLLPYMVKEKWFDSISFDNLALEQLDVKNLMPQDKWDMFYMGDEGSSTMYVDMVNREFAANSTSETRYPLLDNVEDMLNVIHQEKKGKDID